MITKALIIAAGLGSRLGELTKDRPKPLVKLCGLTILERILLSSTKAGIKEFFIVVGYKKELIQEYFKNKNFKINWVINTEWEKANGVSVLKAKPFLQNDNFLLLMSDHIHEQETINKFINEDKNLKLYDSVLAIDRNLQSGVDLEDATKIEIEANYISDIGKDLRNFDAVDTGLFAYNSHIFEALEKVYDQKGNCSLTDGNKVLAENKKFGFFDIGTNFWQDIDTHEDLKNAERKILNKCRKPTDGIISRNFNRHISLFLSKYICKTSLTPNMLSAGVLLVGILSALAVVSHNYLVYVFGLLLFKFASIFDGCDGEIARIKYINSKYGDWIDTTCDNLVGLLFLIAIGAVNYRINSNTFNLFLSIATPILYCVSVVLLIVELKRTGKSGSLVTLNVKLNKGTFSKIIGMVIKRDFFTTVFVILGLFKFTGIILYLNAVVSIVIIARAYGKLLTPSTITK